ncbi:D-glycero-beta-D-manno-heptose 1,7-bisphosphate 7-phosphatase [Simplicispira hankyongi]|uniref:D,D-heptose 1,7-bisphosphate phosphatase n=1 Tax=Simplicispira hankyongi TaxID=2315688 RepID=A0A398C7R5_9BURK|nr:D-glycero-beta-D-manno-heptose 1,7-bisphosphate 7-phosphatase [Simplicispira hankyongi]RID97277.1 D-glycero-beta-D-manno-heptose 1,7-bisphosphate 7-phosphatase [Simplicispira hankyongi]
MKLVILDRDGTLNVPPAGDDFVATPDDWQPLPGALEAVARINRLGWHAVVATNQPGLGRGLFDVATLNAVHAKIHRLLSAAGGRIDAVFYCPHAPGEACSCRKPAPGLFEQICERYGLAPAEVLVVGDNADHLQAGAAIGAQLHLLRSGAEPSGDMPPVLRTHQDLSAFADYLAREAESDAEPAMVQIA